MSDASSEFEELDFGVTAWRRHFGFNSLAIRCALAISSGVIWETAASRSSTASGSCVGRQVQPHVRQNSILRHPLAVQVHDAEIGLRRGVALFGRVAHLSLLKWSWYALADAL